LTSIVLFSFFIDVRLAGDEPLSRRIAIDSKTRTTRCRKPDR